MVLVLLDVVSNAHAGFGLALDRKPVVEVAANEIRTGTSPNEPKLQSSIARPTKIAKDPPSAPPPLR